VENKKLTELKGFVRRADGDVTDNITKVGVLKVRVLFHDFFKRSSMNRWAISNRPTALLPGF